MSITQNLAKIQATIPPNVALVAVSKTKPNADILDAYAAGQRIFGENKALELRDKHAALPQDIEWHFIGRLQTNKVKYIAPFVALIHSVDSEKLLKEINKRAKSNDRTINVLLQVYIAKEDSKTGFSTDEISELVDTNAFDKYPNINVVGFMGMATNTKDESIVAQEFKGLQSFFNALKAGFKNLAVLSMGMSNDYPLAIANGSNMVRIGSSIFGARNYPAK